MAKPVWTQTISNHAVISRDELVEWLEVSASDLKRMIEVEGLPMPRLVGAQTKPGGAITLTHKCKWRAGDVRAWLKGSRKAIDEQVATRLGAERGRWTDKSEAVMCASGVQIARGRLVRREELKSLNKTEVIRNR